MAGEVAHIVYAARVRVHLKDQVKNHLYWIGTLFPDIRHLGIVSRHRTHAATVALNTLVGQDDFETGTRVHAWVDATRQRFLDEANIKELLPWHPFVPHALKLLEDELLYSSFDDWDFIGRLLNKVYDEELHFVSAPERVQVWHGVLKDYFESAPTDLSRYKLSLAIGLTEQSAEEMNNVVKTLRAQKEVQPLIERFLHHLEYLLR